MHIRSRKRRLLSRPCFTRYVYSAGYQRWKRITESQWLHEKISDESEKARKLAEAVREISNNLPSEYVTTRLFYHYNLLRELRKEKPADLPEHIDSVWLENEIKSSLAQTRFAKFVKDRSAWLDRRLYPLV